MSVSFLVSNNKGCPRVGFLVLGLLFLNVYLCVLSTTVIQIDRMKMYNYLRKLINYNRVYYPFVINSRLFYFISNLPNNSWHNKDICVINSRLLYFISCRPNNLSYIQEETRKSFELPQGRVLSIKTRRRLQILRSTSPLNRLTNRLNVCQNSAENVIICFSKLLAFTFTHKEVAAVAALLMLRIFPLFYCACLSFESRINLKPNQRYEYTLIC